MKIINLLELNENAEILVKSEGQSEIYIPEELSANYFKNDVNISGQWLVLDEILKVNNENLIYYEEIDKNRTWIKLPDNYVKENYLIDYDIDDTCPPGIDLLVKEDGYPIGVISGCTSIKQAKINNNLDGHKYKGIFGIEINNNYFISYHKESKKFNILKTSKDWDRGKKTI